MRDMIGRLLTVTKGEGLRAQLIRGGVGSILLKVANMVLVLALSVVLARVLRPSGYGVYVAVIAVVSVLGVPAQLGLQNLVVREVATYQLHEQWSLLKGVLRFSFLVVAGSTLVILLAALAFALFFGHRFAGEEVNTMLWGLALLPLLALGGVRGAALRGLRRVTEGQVPEFILVPGLTLAFVGGYVALRQPLPPSTSMALRAIASLLAFAVGVLLLARALPAAYRRSPAQYEGHRWLRSAVPLSLTGGVRVLHVQTGIIALSVFRSAEETGFFRVASQGAMLVTFALAAISMVIGPQIARLYAAGDYRRLQRLATTSTRLLLLAGLPVALLLIVFGERILGFVFGVAYRPSSGALAVLCLGQLFHAATGTVGLFLNMTGHEIDTVAVTVITTVLNVTLTFALVPSYGVVGAALAFALSEATLQTVLYKKVRDRIGISSLPIRVRDRGSGDG